MKNLRNFQKLKQKISILGCGWLGLALAEILLSKGFEVKSSTTSKVKLKAIEKKGVTPFLINLNKLESNIVHFLDAEILIISIPEKNVSLFENLIAQIEKSRINNVLFISSTSVYDNTNNVVTEKTLVKNCPLSEIERLFRTNTKFKTTIIRFGGLFGYDRKPINFVVANKKIENSEGHVNLIHRDDCIRIIEEIISQNVWDETFNACTDTHPTRRDFYTNEAKKEKRTLPIFNENSLNEYKIIDSEKLKATLNYTFKYSNLLDIL